MKSRIYFIILTAFLFTACSSNSGSGYVPKPKGYNRIDIPEAHYQTLEGNYPYTFEYSKLAEIMPDKSTNAEPYWIIVNYPTLNAKIQFTYKPLNGNLKKLDAHVADAYKLASKHQVRATSQTEQIVSLPNGKKAVVMELEGEVPSHLQFYITDTTQNYLRGAMYLNKATLNDSLTPIVNYIKKDCIHILKTLNWKK